MHARSRITVASAMALGITAAAGAEVGPHSTWYAVHKQTDGRHNNINIVYQRDKRVADVNGVNKCLGSSTPPGSNSAYLNSFDAYPVRVKRGKISFHGKATVFSGTGRQSQQMVMTATLKPTKAVGRITLPGTKCGTIRFTARVALVTK